MKMAKIVESYDKYFLTALLLSNNVLAVFYKNTVTFKKPEFQHFVREFRYLFKIYFFSPNNVHIFSIPFGEQTCLRSLHRKGGR